MTYQQQDSAFCIKMTCNWWSESQRWSRRKKNQHCQERWTAVLSDCHLTKMVVSVVCIKSPDSFEASIYCTWRLEWETDWDLGSSLGQGLYNTRRQQQSYDRPTLTASFVYANNLSNVDGGTSHASQVCLNCRPNADRLPNDCHCGI